MSVNQGTLQQTRELLKHDRLNREQVEALARNGNLCGPLPDPSGADAGEPYWTKQAVVDWSESTKRSRGGLIGMGQRSLVATLLGREQTRQAEQMKSVGELAEGITFGKIDVDEAEQQCAELGISAAALATTVDKIRKRQKLVDRRDRGLVARENAVRLEAEIQMNEADAQEALAPFQDRGAKLLEEKSAAERTSRESDSAERLLINSIPEWLVEATQTTRAACGGPNQRRIYHEGRLRRLDSELAQVKQDLGETRQQLNVLVVQESDYEGKLRRDAITEKKGRLTAQAESIEAERLQSQQAMDSTDDEVGEARKRLQKLESLVYEVWPKPTDV